ncbi:hypothetical protein [Sporosarcina limicola]|uniref:Swarming motility protein SwrB n=1 Tax=Sporosarcina limicola TaxID=34101 RepID=A0A927MLJ6_9BACL|nr:hypothetical protein [Sporosarcina limicola]MBE1553436.1 hypothetical protein [Sporosarcina limicola]
MIPIALLFLFIMQIASFYFLALLYTKISKFDDLEKKQRKLMAEMDNSIGAYLSELKDENERLIVKLSVRDKELARTNKESVQERRETTVSSEDTPFLIGVNTSRIPINQALKSYNAVTTTSVPKRKEPEVTATSDDRILAYEMHDAGQSIEEIAQKLGKGRTEVELILKFR